MFVKMDETAVFFNQSRIQQFMAEEKKQRPCDVLEATSEEQLYVSRQHLMGKFAISYHFQGITIWKDLKELEEYSSWEHV